MKGSPKNLRPGRFVTIIQFRQKTSRKMVQEGSRFDLGVELCLVQGVGDKALACDCTSEYWHMATVPTVALAMIVLVHADSKANVEWVQTALFEDGTMHLLKDMPPLPLSSLEEDVSAEAKALVIDRSRTYQEILGFGGAFTEAAALNWQSLTLADRADVIHLYFGAPEEGGLGYTVGRVPMNSCDFGPGDEQRTYSFANVPNDMHLRHFDDSVAQYDWPESEYSPLLTSHNLLPTSILLPATFDHISGLHAGGVAGWSPVLAAQGGEPRLARDIADVGLVRRGGARGLRPWRSRGRSAGRVRRRAGELVWVLGRVRLGTKLRGRT